MILILIACFVTLAECLTILLINRRDSDIAIHLKKYGMILAAGNLILLVLSWYKQNQSGLDAWWYFGLFAYLLCLTVYDLKFRELPDWWHLFPIVFYIIGWFCGKQPVGLYESIIVTIILAAVLGLIFLLKKDAIGLGDIKLLLICSMYTGSICIGIMIRGMMLAFLVSIGLLLFRKVTTKSELPFVPFLLLGALVI